ncbi:SDR family NAD(P)-dependent oxidoreductase, partial [Acinetobacter variabilis]|uniref:SDR family NAD(P)-dependent oxidoreductase n=1 Tax=Acinetobacter variabilis TaxID=70346 RepID=UPI0021D1F7A3
MAKLENLQGKVVWITGASSGIGKALAEECAAQGAQIVLTAQRLEELEKVRSGLVNPDQHIAIVADITDESQVRTAYEQVLRALLHKDLKCKAPLIEPNLRRNLGK